MSSLSVAPKSRKSFLPPRFHHSAPYAKQIVLLELQPDQETVSILSFERAVDQFWHDEAIGHWPFGPSRTIATFGLWERLPDAPEIRPYRTKLEAELSDYRAATRMGNAFYVHDRLQISESYLQ
jgi:hypothetical protein